MTRVTERNDMNWNGLKQKAKIGFAKDGDAVAFYHDDGTYEIRGDGDDAWIASKDARTVSQWA